MTVSAISVQDMHCAVCAQKVRRSLATLCSIKNAHINLVRRQIYIEHQDNQSVLDVLAAIEAAGFTPTLTELSNHDQEQQQLLKRLGIAGLAAMQVMMVAIALYAGAMDHMAPDVQRLLHFTSLLFATPVICYAAVPFFRGALAGLKKRSLTMDLPVATALTMAFAISLHATVSGQGEVYFDSVVMFTFLLLCARYINTRLQRRFDLSSKLLSALPQHAWRVTNHEHQSVALQALNPGDRIWVPEGAQIPVDGTAEHDPSNTPILIDEAMLTGESEWVSKPSQAALYAGTLNAGRGFFMRASSRVEQSRIVSISRLADQTELSQTQVSQFSDKIAGVFIPAVLTLAGVTFVVWRFVEPDNAVTAALSVLVVSCPCALSLATPAALTAAMTRLRQLGVVLTNSLVLERALTIDRLYIDKTGTLTHPEPSIQGTRTLTETFSQSQCLAMAADLQRYTSHPIARAFRPYQSQTDQPSTLTKVTVYSGQGVEGFTPENHRLRVGSAAFVGLAEESARNLNHRWVYLALDQELIAQFELSNAIRPDAVAAIQALQGLGIQPIMLSGDHPQRCAETADALGIEFFAQQSPETKLAAIRREQALGGHVLMVGDGINDIPVLAGADVSAAVVEATELVKSKADVLLLNAKLTPLAQLFHIAHKTRQITRQNLLWAAAYNLTAIPLAAAGFMPPWIAALGMATSSVLVMINSSRLLKGMLNFDTPPFPQRRNPASKGRESELFTNDLGRNNGSDDPVPDTKPLRGLI